jgi:hypothetical protein
MYLRDQAVSGHTQSLHRHSATNFVHRKTAGTCLRLHEMSKVKGQTPAITITAVQDFLPDPEFCYNDTNNFSFEIYCIHRRR